MSNHIIKIETESENLTHWEFRHVLQCLQNGFKPNILGY